MTFPEKPADIDLHPLEWRLLAPRIPFMKIYAAPRGKQKKIRGNVVNVPVDVANTVNMLPRAVDDTMTIAAELKRQLKQKHAEMTETIRPYNIREAALWLEKNGELYRKEGITFRNKIEMDELFEHLSYDDEIDSEANNDNNSETIASHENEKETRASNENETETIASHESEKEKIASNENETETIASHESEKETRASNENETETIASHESEKEKIASNENETETIASHDNETEQIASHDCRLEPMLKKGDDDDDDWSEDEGQEISGSKDTMFTSPDFIENNEKEKIHSFAPGEGNFPLSPFMDKHCEELAFPNIFYGNSRQSEKDRKAKVYYSEICKSEMRSKDRRAAKVIENIFFKLKKSQMKQLAGKVQIALRKNKIPGQKLTAGDLTTPGTVNNVVQFNEGFMILKTLRGSPPYFKIAQTDLFAMIRQLGPATYFCSFSAAETRWKHLLRILGITLDNKEYTDKEIEEMDWETKCRLISSDPVTCARHFDFQVNLLFKDILKQTNSPLGKVTDFFYRVEFQHRGSPHVHALLWVADAPVYGETTLDEISEFIDSKITCSKNGLDENMQEFIKYQFHSHSHTCRRKNEKICRFGFPKPPMPQTEILLPLDKDMLDRDQLKHKKNYAELKTLMNDMKEGHDITFDEFLAKTNLSYDDYIMAIRASINHATVFLKRRPDELRINSYNPALLGAWQANLDIQFVLDVYACAMYIASYIAKSQRGISDLLRKACQEVQNGNLSIREQVRVIGNKFLTNVEISAQEAVYIILQLPMRKSSRQVLFINTSPPEERVRLLKSQEELEKMDKDDDNVVTCSLIDRYQNRQKILHNVTLADYAAFYDIKKRYNKRSTSENDDTLNEDADEHNSDDESDDDEEMDNSGKIKRRAIPRVIRYVNFNIDKDKEKHYRELLMLFTSWRNEETDLLDKYTSYEEKYFAMEEQIKKQRAFYEGNRDAVDNAMDMEVNAVEDAWDEQAPHAQQVDREDEAEEQAEVEALTKKGIPTRYEYDIGADIGAAKEKNDELTLFEMPEEEYRLLMRKLNDKQLTFVNDTLHSLKTTDRQLFRFLSGGAGVGKSFVTTALFQGLLRFYKSKAGDDYHAIRQILLAPTGKAAYNIKGNTIHSALKVPINQSFTYKSLDSSTLNTLRTKLGGLKVVFIDEISMVGNGMLNFVNQRLQDIKGSPLLFGGVSIIAVGDLFQLRPVCDGYIFQNLRNVYGALASNLWQDHFTMYELTDIMRQKESKIFAELLNRLRELNYDNATQQRNDMALLKTRMLQTENDKYPYETQHLFISNDKMNEFNTKVFDNMHGDKVTIKAKDSIVGSAAQAVAKALLANIPDDPKKTMQLHTNLHLVQGLRCEVCINVRTDDGLTNGAGCTVKLIEVSKARLALGSIVWVQFDDDNIGKQIRTELNSLYKSGVEKTWTPILPVSRQIKVGKYKNAELMRTQIPLRPSAAKTIHRSQGDTLDQVVVDFDGRQTAHIHYVGLSRVRTIEGLQIINLAENKIKVNSEVKAEMDKLRTVRKMELLSPVLPQKSSDNIVIMYHNVRSLQKYIQDVANNRSLLLASIIILAETRLKCSDDSPYNIKGYTLYRNDVYTTKIKSHHGIAVYISTDIALNNEVQINHMNCRGTEMTLITFHFRQNNIELKFNVVGLYKPPKIKRTDLITSIMNALSKVSDMRNTVILGDFNIQNDSADCEIVRKFLQMEQIINEPTTDANTIIDHIYSNVSKDFVYAGCLETYYSDHKILFCMLSNSKLDKPVYSTEKTHSVADFQPEQTETYIRSKTHDENMSNKQKPFQNSNRTDTRKKRQVKRQETKLVSGKRKIHVPSIEFDAIVCRSFGLYLQQSDINILTGTAWLNDQLINFYLKILELNETNANTYAVKILDTHAYIAMTNMMENSVSTYSPLNVLDYNKIVIPIFFNQHWSLVVVFVQSKEIKYYDSIVHKQFGKECLSKIRTFLELTSGGTVCQWKLVYEQNVTKQDNTYDCGVCVCMNTDLILQGMSLKNRKKELCGYRRKMLQTIQEDYMNT